MLNTVKHYSKPRILKRPGSITVADGFKTRAADTVIPIDAAVQPLSPKELRNVPEGQNELEWKNIWSGSEMKNKDKVEVNGIDYTIQKVEYWEEGSFYHAKAVKVIE